MIDGCHLQGPVVRYVPVFNLYIEQANDFQTLEYNKKQYIYFMITTLKFKYRFEAEMFRAFIEECHIDVPHMKEGENELTVEFDSSEKDEIQFVKDCYAKFKNLPSDSFIKELEENVDAAHEAWEDRNYTPSINDYLVND